MNGESVDEGNDREHGVCVREIRWQR